MSFFDIPGAKKPKKEKVIVKYTSARPPPKPSSSSSFAAPPRPSVSESSPRSSVTPESSSSQSKKRTISSTKPKRPRERELKDEARDVPRKRKRSKLESDSDSDSEDGDGSRAGSSSKTGSPRRLGSPAWPEPTEEIVNLKERDIFDLKGMRGGGEVGATGADEGRWKGSTHSADIVNTSAASYIAYFPQDGFSPEDHPEVAVSYPRIGCQERFSLLAPKALGEYSPLDDLLRTIQLIGWIYVPASHAAEFGTLRSDVISLDEPEEGTLVSNGQLSILRSLSKAFNRKDGAGFAAAVQRFNVRLEDLKNRGELRPELDEDKWIGLVNGIDEQVYQRKVGPATASLSDYLPFSDNVYGELLPRFMTEIFARFRLGPHSVLLDLGSGVSNITIQASLQAGCVTLGCEQMPNPAKLALEQIDEAKKRWSMWCVKGNEDCRAVEGDFCDNTDVNACLKVADMILVNNYAFTPSLNEKLTFLFLELKEGARIISLKPFLPRDFRLNERTASSPLAVLKMRELLYPGNSVSWTNEGGRYYEHIIDRSAISAFIEAKNRRFSSRQ